MAVVARAKVVVTVAESSVEARVGEEARLVAVLVAMLAVAPMADATVAALAAVATVTPMVAEAATAAEGAVVVAPEVVAAPSVVMAATTVADPGNTYLARAVTAAAVLEAAVGSAAAAEEAARAAGLVARSAGMAGVGLVAVVEMAVRVEQAVTGLRWRNSQCSRRQATADRRTRAFQASPHRFEDRMNSRI